MDWSGCELIEVVPGKVSGAPLLKGTRVPADALVENRELGQEEVAAQFGVPVEQVAQVLDYWSAHVKAA